jgi:urease accessory protein
MSDFLTWQVVDSAFPTGVFAHSWGLEAAWQQGEVERLGDVQAFLEAVILQTGYGTVPLLTAAHRDPAELESLDALTDAFLLNTVANRASRVQGRTLAATAARIWPSSTMTSLRRRVELGPGHVAPVSGAALRAMGLSLEQSQRVALFGAARGVLTAAVRLGIIGSFEAQRLQHGVGPWLDTVAAQCGGLGPEDLAQPSPLVDLWQAGHDRLYSRLFQS